MDVALTDGFVPEPTQVNPSQMYPPSHSDIAAVATTVTVVGVLMALLFTWLAVRLRRAAQSEANAIPITPHRPSFNASYVFRPSFAPPNTSSKFGFIRKPLRLSHQRADGSSWDFADPDPFSHQKESALDTRVRTPSQKRRPAPLTPVPAYTACAHRASTHKDEYGPRTPTTPMDCVEPPPPAYCRESSPWLVYQPKDLPPS